MAQLKIENLAPFYPRLFECGYVAQLVRAQHS